MVKTPSEVLAALVKDGSSKWARHRKAEEKDARAFFRRRDVMVRDHKETQKEVAYEVMEEALCQGRPEAKSAA